ncbi:MAG TPA: zinc ribbon domain-containing protein [Kofleriaceae bacterium]|jgi:hypothetical protein
MESTSSLGHYEMLWDCDHCDQKGLLGKSQRHCPQCGAPQNPDKRYFPPEGSEVKAEGHKFEGADRTCPACSEPMNARALMCTHCGSPMDGAAQIKQLLTPKPVFGVPPQKSNLKRTLIIIGASVAFIFIIWFIFFRTKIATVKVTGHRWNDIIRVEEWGPVRHEAWRDSVPIRAMSSSCIQKQRSTRKVDTGQQSCSTSKKDNGDGTFEKTQNCHTVYRDEPVYDDWCTYSLDEWHQIDKLAASGAGLSPTWPATDLPTTALETYGSRRQGERIQTLTLDFGKDNCDVKDPIWRKYADGQSYKLNVRVRTGAVVCGDLK